MNDSDSIAAIMEEVSRCSGMLKAILQRHEQTAQMTSPKRVRKQFLVETTSTPDYACRWHQQHGKKMSATKRQCLRYTA